MSKKRDKNIVTQRDGVGIYGLYFGFIVADKTGKLYREERRFLVKNMLCTYSRNAGVSRATWRVYNFDTHAEARAALDTNLGRYTGSVEMFGDVLLVEMTSSDLEAINRREAPYGRHNGTATITRLFGKIDDDTWTITKAAS